MRKAHGLSRKRSRREKRYKLFERAMLYSAAFLMTLLIALLTTLVVSELDSEEVVIASEEIKSIESNIPDKLVIENEITEAFVSTASESLRTEREELKHIQMLEAEPISEFDIQYPSDTFYKPYDWEYLWETNSYDETLDLLSRIIYAESGADYCSDEMQLAVGSVVMNRLMSSQFPSDSLYSVIYQEGQYQPTWNGMIDKASDDRAYNNALTILSNGCVLPKDVIFQAEFKQGTEVYLPIEYTIGDITKIMYFCK